MADGLLIRIGQVEFLIHQSILIWLGILTLVGILLVYAGRSIERADPSKAPEGDALLAEILSDICRGVVGGNLKDNTWRYIPLYGTIMICMLISCLMGLVGLQPPTSNLSVNITITLIMIFLIHGTDIKRHGVSGKLKSLAQPMAFLFPLNVIGDFALPVSLTLRLFGNMLAGTIIVTLLYSLIKAIMPFGVLAFAVTPFLHMYFDIFTALMQTYIFAMLTSFFLGDVVNE